jgi:hypothetical protein
VGAMKARCGNVSGCTQFNTNGYLYSESTAVSPFSEYPLECWSFEGPPGPAPLVNVTLDVALNDGLLEYSITFDSTGSLSLWAYTVLIAQVKTTSTTRAVSTNSARQLVGFFQAGSMGAVSGGTCTTLLDTDYYIGAMLSDSFVFSIIKRLWSLCSEPASHNDYIHPSGLLYLLQRPNAILRLAEGRQQLLLQTKQR